MTTFHSETGTEGGYWAFQDEKFIEVNTTFFVCTKCGRVWDKKRQPEGFKVWPDDKPCEHNFKLNPPVMWSYDGLHILKDDDHLVIYSEDDTVVWSGKIELKQLGLFTDHAHGMWIHADQNGIPSETWASWFMKE